ncbi:MAG: ribonuclease P protein component [Candidatus Magasanikbacteria bacterium]|nr:ribonuclease P protein component [Candidatus Magasanikbacteria bacterium]
MLAPVYRLRKVRDFNLLVAHGRTWRGRLFDLKYLQLAKIRQFFPVREDPIKFARQLKIGVAVGAKVERRAVGRNRLKRQMREAIRLLLKTDHLPAGYYCLVVARRPAIGKDFAAISQEIALALQQSGVWQ